MVSSQGRKTFKQIEPFELVDWELAINDDDEFRITNKMTGDKIVIKSDDKFEFSLIAERILSEITDESHYGDDILEGDDEDDGDGDGEIVDN